MKVTRPRRPMPGALFSAEARKTWNKTHTGEQKHVHNEVSIANQQGIRRERSLLDRLLAPNSGSLGESDLSLIGSLTAAAVRLHSQNRKTSVTVPSESHANKNIRSQCTVLILFAMREHLPGPPGGVEPPAPQGNPGLAIANITNRLLSLVRQRAPNSRTEVVAFYAVVDAIAPDLDVAEPGAIFLLHSVFLVNGRQFVAG